MNKTIKDLLIILVITLVAGALLGGVYTITKEPIAKQKAKAEKQALAAVMSEAENFEAMEVRSKEFDYAGADLEKVFRATDAEGKLLGYVLVITSHEGYGGDITFTLGIATDGTTKGISITSIGETVGLGMNAGKVLVPQFSDKRVEAFQLTKNEPKDAADIQAISSATITSTAIVNAVNAGIDYYRLALGGVGNE